MGFLDNLKQGADNLAGSVIKAVSGNQNPNQPRPQHPSDNYFHDLGVLI